MDTFQEDSSFAKLFSYPIYLAELYREKYYVMSAEMKEAAKKPSGSLKLFIKAVFIRVEDTKANSIVNISDMDNFRTCFANPTKEFPIVNSITAATNFIRGCNASSKTLDRLYILATNHSSKQFEWIRLGQFFNENTFSIPPAFDSTNRNRTYDICVANEFEKEIKKYSQANCKVNTLSHVQEEQEEEYEEEYEDERDDSEDETYTDRQLENNEENNYRNSYPRPSTASPPNKRRRIQYDDIVRKQLQLLNSKISEMHTLLVKLTDSVTALQNRQINSSPQEQTIESIIGEEEIVEGFKKCMIKLLSAIESDLNSLLDDDDDIEKRRIALKEGLEGKNKLYFIKKIDRMLSKKNEYPGLYEKLCATVDENQKQCYEEKIIEYIKTNDKNFYEKYSK